MASKTKNGTKVTENTVTDPRATVEVGGHYWTPRGYEVVAGTDVLSHPSRPM
jgi:membrane protein implicated in regulation of membrane protease activity